MFKVSGALELRIKNYFSGICVGIRCTWFVRLSWNNHCFPSGYKHIGVGCKFPHSFGKKTFYLGYTKKNCGHKNSFYSTKLSFVVVQNTTYFSHKTCSVPCGCVYILAFFSLFFRLRNTILKNKNAGAHVHDTLSALGIICIWILQHTHQPLDKIWSIWSIIHIKKSLKSFQFSCKKHFNFFF